MASQNNICLAWSYSRFVINRYTDWSRGRGQTKNSPWSSRLGAGNGPITHPLKTKQITETLNTRRQSSLGANVVPCLSKQSMTPLSQSREEAQELNKPLMTPRAQIRIGNWNVRTMYKTWRRTAEREREKAGWKDWSEVQIAAADRAGWQSCVEALCAT